MKYKDINRIIATGVLVILLSVALFGAREAAASGSGGPITAPVNWHMQSGSGLVADAWATLHTRENGASFTFHAAELKKGHVYTIWFVVINAPENCATKPCTPADVLLDTENVQANVTYGAGHVVGESGMAAFAGFIPVGEMPDGWFTTPFTNPLGAEIHLVLNDHGPLIPNLASDMIQSYRGGCTDESLPPIFPDTAFADGIPGPNTCRLYQVAIFEQ
jgi:hypothetical protein